MNMFTNSILRLIILLVATSLFLISCDNTVDGDADDHADAFGFVIEQNNAEILRFQNNQYVLNPDGAWNEYFTTVDGEQILTISPDVVPDMSRGMTPSVFVRWLDRDGNKFDLPEEADGGEYRLEFDWTKPNVLSGECSDEARVQDLNQIRPANIEQHGSDGSWGFHLRGDHSGTDEIVFRLMHVDHDDFVSRPLRVHVAYAEHPQITEDGIWQHERNKCRTR